MNKQLLYVPLLLAGLNISCSTHNNTVAQPSEQDAASKTAQTKPMMRHQPTPEGVISVDIVNFDDRLHLLTGKNQKGQKTLWYQVSDDGGEGWSEAAMILNDDNIPANMTRGNDAQITAQNNTVVVSWMSYVEGARFNAGPMLTARSTDGGKNWQYAATPPDWNKGAHGYIDMTADAQAMHAVWLDSRNGLSDVKASQGLHYARSTDGGLSWQANQTVDELTCSCCWNTLKSDAGGTPYVLYRDKQPSDLSIAVINSQKRWQRLNHVGAFDWQFEGCPHIGGGLDFQHNTGKTRLHSVVGTGHPDHLGVHYLYSDDAGKSWSKAQQLGDESAIHADIAAQDNGRIVTVWDMMGADGLAVFYAESRDSGESWSKVEQISKAGMRASHPRIVKTKSGFLTVWTEHDGRQQTLAMRRL
jgi:hypothetical protein